MTVMTMMPRSAYARRLAELIAERRQEVLESLAVGLPHDEYLRLVGRVQGLDEGVELLKEAEREAQ
jgi:hypothetical protein